MKLSTGRDQKKDDMVDKKEKERRRDRIDSKGVCAGQKIIIPNHFRRQLRCDRFSGKELTNQE